MTSSFLVQIRQTWLTFQISDKAVICMEYPISKFFRKIENKSKNWIWWRRHILIKLGETTPPD